MSGTRGDVRLNRRRSVARSYRRLGYHVVVEPRGEELPLFLRGFLPDLVVTADDDRAVILIRSRENLIGSREVVDVAAAVASHREWRFELVSTGRSVTLPVVLSSEELDQLLAPALSDNTAGRQDVALIYLVSLLDELVHDAVVWHDIRGRDRSARALIGELSFLGVIEDATADVLEQAWDWRNRIVHGRSASPGPSREDVRRVMDACRELAAATKLQAAACEAIVG